MMCWNKKKTNLFDCRYDDWPSRPDLYHLRCLDSRRWWFCSNKMRREMTWLMDRRRQCVQLGVSSPSRMYGETQEWTNKSLFRDANEEKISESAEDNRIKSLNTCSVAKCEGSKAKSVRALVNFAFENLWPLLSVTTLTYRLRLGSGK